MWTYLLVISVCCYSIASDYAVPSPNIEVFKPRGFRMTILHEEGVEGVVYHVNVNKLIGMREGQYTRYVLRPVNGLWVYDNNALALSVGDIIYYWLSVTHSGKGYRSSQHAYVVQEFSSEDEKTTTEASYITRPPAVASTTSSPTTTSGTTSNHCNIFVQNVTQSIFHLENQMNILREENSILRDLASGDNLRLNLTGLITLTGEPLEIVRFVLDEKLDVEARVVKNAWKTANATVTFEVYTLDDKVDIIRRAKDKLMQSTQIKITYK